MLTPEYSKKFKKDLKKIKKQGYDIEEIKNILNKLINEEDLEIKYKDHELIGNYNNHRECHIKSDLLLIYKIYKINKTIKFIRTGSHSELFSS